MPFYMIKRKYNVIGGNMMQLKKKCFGRSVLSACVVKFFYFSLLSITVMHVSCFLLISFECGLE